MAMKNALPLIAPNVTAALLGVDPATLRPCDPELTSAALAAAGATSPSGGAGSAVGRRVKVRRGSRVGGAGSAALRPGAPPLATPAAALGAVLHAGARVFTAGFFPGFFPTGFPGALMFDGVMASSWLFDMWLGLPNGEDNFHTGAAVGAGEDLRAMLAGMLYLLLACRMAGLDYMDGRYPFTAWLERAFAQLRGGTGATLGPNNTRSMLAGHAVTRLAQRFLLDLNAGNTGCWLVVAKKATGAGPARMQFVLSPLAHQPSGAAVEGESLTFVAALALPPVGSFDMANAAVLRGDPAVRAATRRSALVFRSPQFPAMVERLTAGTAAAAAAEWLSLVTGAAVRGGALTAGEATAKARACGAAARTVFASFTANPSRLMAEIALRLLLSLGERQLLGAGAAAEYTRPWVAARSAVATDLEPLLRVALGGDAAPAAHVRYMAEEMASTGVHLAFSEFKRGALATLAMAERHRGNARDGIRSIRRGGDV